GDSGRDACAEPPAQRRAQRVRKPPGQRQEYPHERAGREQLGEEQLLDGRESLLRGGERSFERFDGLLGGGLFGRLGGAWWRRCKPATAREGGPGVVLEGFETLGGVLDPGIELLELLDSAVLAGFINGECLPPGFLEPFLGGVLCPLGFAGNLLAGFGVLGL